jgi:predicted Zn-dependent protease
VPFAALDTAAAARALSQIADREDDLADLYLERRERTTLPPEEEGPGILRWREEGLAVRLVRQGRTWLAARDAIDGHSFRGALRQVARALPAAAYPDPALEMGPWPEGDATPALATFARGVQRALRAHHVAFPLRLQVQHHRRWLQVVGTGLVVEPQVETFYSFAAELPWGRYGNLFPARRDDGEFPEGAAEQVARALIRAFRAREAAPPEAHRAPLVLAPDAAAVLLHEAVAHALEADTLALGGRPGAAVGVPLAAPLLSVLDSPGDAPESVRRQSDDEGTPVERRWLLRQGKVEDPLADRLWARQSPSLNPGAARRGSRHLPPGPRSTHLEALPGEESEAQLLAGADGGLYITVAERGHLDPLTGAFELHLPYARRTRGGEIAEMVGPCRLRGTVSELLGRIDGLGAEVHAAGAGWCAKGGQKMPVWATTPALRLADVEVLP